MLEGVVDATNPSSQVSREYFLKCEKGQCKQEYWSTFGLGNQEWEFRARLGVGQVEIVTDDEHRGG